MSHLEAVFKVKRFTPDVIFLIKDKFLIFVDCLLLVFTVY